MGLSLVWNSAAGALDLSIENGQLLTGDDYATLFLVQMFSSNVQIDGLDVWWGNSYQQFPVGSQLPLLIRAIKGGTGNVVMQAKNYTEAALKPFLDLGIINSLSVTTAWVTGNGTNYIQINVTITLPGNPTPITNQYGLNVNGTYFIIQ
jgi:phage gp46-like protein